MTFFTAVTKAQSLMYTREERNSHLIMMFWRREVNCEGNKSGKYLCRNPNTSTWPTGVRGMIRIAINGIKVKRSRKVLLRVATSLGFNVPPAMQG